MSPRIKKSSFGVLPDGREVDLYTLTNANGLICKIATYGGTMTELLTPDRHGGMSNIILGYPRLEDYLKGKAYCGALIGRVANRIGQARFILDGATYDLAANNGRNHLHGGRQAFDKKLWRAEISAGQDSAALHLKYTSPNGEEGYPGALEVAVTYTLTNANELRLSYRATADKPTPVNLTSHPYWNLAGHGSVLGHELMIAADHFTATNEEYIPTGEIKAVEGTPYDFRKPVAIKKRLKQLTNTTRGFNENYVLQEKTAARIYEPKSGRVLTLRTDQPGLQFYSGTFLEAPHEPYAGFCLEPQQFPDAVNHSAFPSCILRPGEVYTQETACQFSTV